ncbi:MAG: chaperonin GroEL [Clostridia bacterium]|nr:chaperonin GroEL [Clostridia bacterium]MDD4375875.1 chaperonin GroEL [Clostridia bacterium]
MSKEFLFSEEAKDALERGVEMLMNATKITLGPKGRNVVIERDYASPLITNDGVTIAKEVDVENAFENIGVELVKEVAVKTNDMAGDGTTTAIVLAGTMIKEGLKQVRNGANPVMLKRGMDKATKIALEEAEKCSTDIKGKEDIVRVGAVSAGEQEIGEIIANAMEKVTADGVITVEESRTMNTELEIVEGMKLDRGYLSAYMVSDTEKMEIDLDDPYILITDKKISSIQEIVPILEQVVEQSKKLLIIADDVEGEALSTLIINKIRGVLTSVAIKAPSFGDKRKDMLEDIACLTGGNVISEEIGKSLKDVEINDLGNARRVKISKDSTVIVDGAGAKSQIEARIKNIRKRIEDEEEEYEIEKLRERLSKLLGGVAVIKVGCPTETEMREKKLRIEDALAATEAATKEGIVAGGGITYLNIIKNIEKKCEDLKGDEKIGAMIVMSSLNSPAKQILENAGVQSAVILDKIKNLKDGEGYDVLSEKFVDMKNAGILDPTMVTKCALQNAASIASMILTTEVMVVNTKNENQNSDFNMPRPV